MPAVLTPLDAVNQTAIGQKKTSAWDLINPVAGVNRLLGAIGDEQQRVQREGMTKVPLRGAKTTKLGVA